MSLLSLSLFASVCLIIELIYVIFVRLYVMAGAQCETRPFLSRARGYIVFLLCCAAGSVHKHAATSFVLLSFSLGSGCAAFGRQPLCNSSPRLVTDVPCLCVCVCVWLHPSVALSCAIPLSALFLQAATRSRTLGPAHWLRPSMGLN